MAKPCRRKDYGCTKPRNPARKDGYCSAKCKKADRWDYYKDVEKGRRCDPDHGWF